MTGPANILLAFCILALGYCTLQHVDVVQTTHAIQFTYHECKSAPASTPWPKTGAESDQKCPAPH